MASTIIQWRKAHCQDFNLKQVPLGTLTNDQGLSTHGQEPATASWALLPDECDSSRPLNVPELKVNEF